jgi:hypothetical protein
MTNTLWGAPLLRGSWKGSKSLHERAVMSIALLSADLSGMPDRDQVVAELHEFAKPN